MTVRVASPEDARGLERLAALDSGAVPTGPVLVAEIDGELVAALPLGGGRALADPFRRTSDLVRLLELRADQLRESPAPPATSVARVRLAARQHAS